jgi:hypothetical protein
MLKYASRLYDSSTQVFSYDTVVTNSPRELRQSIWLPRNVKTNSSQSPEEQQLQHSRLRNDIEVVRKYGESHPDEWTDVFFENDPTVRVIALLAGPHRELHERTLLELVENPDQLEFREAMCSRLQLSTMLSEVRLLSDADGILSLGIVRGKMNLWLAANQEVLAANLRQQFGEVLDIRVGAFEFPPSDEPPPRVVRRSPDVNPIVLEELDVTLSNELTVTSGSSLRSSLMFTNRGHEEVVLNTNGAITARILDPETLEVVGGLVGAQTMPLIGFSVAPTETVAVPLTVATASFTRSFGYVIPPGVWMIDAIDNVQDKGERQIPPQPIVIMARQI